MSKAKFKNSLTLLFVLYLFIFPYRLPLSTLSSLILVHLSGKLCKILPHNLDIFWPLRPFDMTELGIVLPEKNSWEFYLRHPKMCRKERRTNEFVLCNIWHSMRQLLLLLLLLPRQLLLILLLPWLADNFACHLINCHANYGVNIITFYSAVNLCVRATAGKRNQKTLDSTRLSGPHDDMQRVNLLGPPHG